MSKHNSEYRDFITKIEDWAKEWENTHIIDSWWDNNVVGKILYYGIFKMYVMLIWSFLTVFTATALVLGYFALMAGMAVGSVVGVAYLAKIIIHGM